MSALPNRPCAEAWKIEFALVDDEGDEFAWFDEYDDAVHTAMEKYANDHRTYGVMQIWRYADEREPIFSTRALEDPFGPDELEDEEIDGDPEPFDHLDR